MEVTDVGAPGGKKVSGSLLRKAKQFFIFLAYHLYALHVS